MPATAIRKLTWEDIKDLPESHGRTEIVDGELILSPIAARSHLLISHRLSEKLAPQMERDGRGTFFPGPIHIVLAEGFNYEPDLCFISAGRLEGMPDAVFYGAPDLVIEIISDSNRTHDTVVKFRDYEKYGVEEYWLVDRREQHIRVFHRNASGKYALLGVFPKGANVESRLFPGLSLDPAEVLN